MPRIGVIVGLASEAECLETIASEHRPPVAVAGASAARATSAAAQFLNEDCAGVVSFGLAGGLDPDIEPGTVVVADAILAPDGVRHATDDAWRRALAVKLDGRVLYRTGTIAGSSGSIDGADAKIAFNRRTGALAVDMESHGVAEAARRAGKPFIAVRVVADPATRSIPPWLLAAIADDGTIRPGVIAGGLFLQPWKVWELIGLARENGRAIAALRRVALHAGPDFGLGA